MQLFSLGVLPGELPGRMRTGDGVRDAGEGRSSGADLTEADMEHPEWFCPDEYEPDCDKWGSCNRSENPMQVCRHATTRKRHNCAGRQCPRRNAP